MRLRSLPVNIKSNLLSSSPSLPPITPSMLRRALKAGRAPILDPQMKALYALKDMMLLYHFLQVLDFFLVLAVKDMVLKMLATGC